MSGLTWFEKNLHTERQRRLFEQERLILEATEGICDAMEAKAISKADLARRLGKSRPYVTQILNGARNMTLRTLADVFFACGAQVHFQLLPLRTPSFVLDEGTAPVTIRLPEQPWQSLLLANLEGAWKPLRVEVSWQGEEQHVGSCDPEKVTTNQTHSDAILAA